MVVGSNADFWDIAIVGGGILGLSIAALAAQRGYSVGLFRLSDIGCPRADTLRNQGWLQSGLMLIGHFEKNRERGRILARQMHAAGHGMLKDLGLPLPTDADCGVLRVSSESDAGRLEEDAEVLRLANVRRLNADDVRPKLGSIFEDGIYYSIPDVPFPEGMVLQQLRDWSIREGVTCIQVDTPLTFQRASHYESGVSIEYNGRKAFSKITVAAAGAGNFKLLENLEIKPKMTLQQTPLLVLHDCLSITAPIYADRQRKFSFVRHAPDRLSLPNGALVIGTKHDRQVMHAAPEHREIIQSDIEEFKRYLPSCLHSYIDRGRFTAGYEVIPDETSGRKHVEPWIEWIDELPSLLMAFPGRATMGMFTARQVLERLESRLGAPSRGATPALSQNPQWNDSIYMHFDTRYSFDDSRPRNGGM